MCQKQWYGVSVTPRVLSRMWKKQNTDKDICRVMNGSTSNSAITGKLSQFSFSPCYIYNNYYKIIPSKL